jgi:hypothetical protein
MKKFAEAAAHSEVFAVDETRKTTNMDDASAAEFPGTKSQDHQIKSSAAKKGISFVEEKKEPDTESGQNGVEVQVPEFISMFDQGRSRSQTMDMADSDFLDPSLVQKLSKPSLSAKKSSFSMNFFRASTDTREPEDTIEECDDIDSEADVTGSTSAEMRERLRSKSMGIEI